MDKWPKVNNDSDENNNLSGCFDDEMFVPVTANTMDNNRKRTFSARLIAASERYRTEEPSYNGPAMVNPNIILPKRMRFENNESFNDRQQAPKIQVNDLPQTVRPAAESAGKSGAATLLQKSALLKIITGSVKTVLYHHKTRPGSNTVYEVYGELIK